MEKHVRTVDMEDTVEKVESVMAETGLSMVPEVDAKGSVFGSISVADLLYCNVTRKKPAAARIWEICTHRAIETRLDASSADVAQWMLNTMSSRSSSWARTRRSWTSSSLDFVKDYLVKGA